MQFRPMGVDPAGWNFGLDKLNRELDRHQFIRELTQNGIEAIQQTESGVGDVTWELYPLPIGDVVINKLCCIDNGVGMTGPELVEYINTGFKSGKERAHQGNFGIGAKVSSLTFNTAGVLYLSWKDGEGSMIHLAQDKETGYYGLNQLVRPDGTFGWWAPIGDNRKPDQIKTHGTVVILMGDSIKQDTFEKPKESPLPAAYWVGAYLQRKYFRFPDGITVRARAQSTNREGRESPGDKFNRRLETIRGQKHILERCSEVHGEVAIQGAKIHYWLLTPPPKEGPRTGNVFRRAFSHVAALYKDELHEIRQGAQGGYPRLASFGVAVGMSRVVLYVEPDLDTVEANLTRQYLMVDGERLPWLHYAAAFSENMPEPIKEMMNNLLAQADSRSNMDKVKERLRELAEMLSNASKYRPDENGDIKADTPTTGGGESETTQEKKEDSDSGGMGGLRGHIYRLIQSPSGAKAKKTKAKVKQPDVIWVSHREGTRERGFLEERAAYYDSGSNTITASKDFYNFQKVVKAIHRAVPESNGAAEAAAMFEFETVLVETVMNILAREGSQHWTSEEVQQQYSPESMTNAVNHTFHILIAAQNEIAQQKKKANQLAKQLDA